MARECQFLTIFLQNFGKRLKVAPLSLATVITGPTGPVKPLANSGYGSRLLVTFNVLLSFGYHIDH